MNLDFSEIIMLIALLMIYLFIFVGIKKFHGIELLKNTTKREKLISIAVFIIMIFAMSVFVVRSCESAEGEAGFINETMSDILYEIYEGNMSFIYFVRFIMLEMISLFICMMAVKNAAIKLNVPNVNYAYLILTTILSAGTYCIVESNWTSNIVLLLLALFVLCLTDCSVYSITKKKVAYMFLNMIVLAVLCMVDHNIQIKMFAYIAAIFIPQLILVLLIKAMYKLRNIWQKLVIILYFVVVCVINWKLLCG